MTIFNNLGSPKAFTTEKLKGCPQCKDGFIKVGNERPNGEASYVPCQNCCRHPNDFKKPIHGDGPKVCYTCGKPSTPRGSLGPKTLRH